MGTIVVHRVHIPPLSTIGYGWGIDEDGDEVQFVGDHRPMRNIGEAVQAADTEDDLPRVSSDDCLNLRGLNLWEGV